MKIQKFGIQFFGLIRVELSTTLYEQVFDFSHTFQSGPVLDEKQYQHYHRVKFQQHLSSPWYEANAQS